MKKNRFSFLFLITALSLFLFGCHPSKASHLQATPGAAETIPIKGTVSVTAPEGMALYSSCPFTYEEKEWELQLFVQEDMLIDGELALDDRGHFLIQAVSDAKTYLFFDETVQLGIPAADVLVDAEEELHIILRDIRSARYQITDFQYSLDKDEFIGQRVISQDGSNYWGTVPSGGSF